MKNEDKWFLEGFWRQ